MYYDGYQVLCEYDNYDRLTRKFLYGTGIDEPVRMLIVQQATDITSDGWIDIHDIHAMAATWLRQAGDIDFNGAADLNRDNAINNMDSDILSANFNSAGSSVVIIYYYHFDGSGNVIALSDSSGDTVETYAYDVFGRIQILSASDEPRTTSDYDNPYFFTGRRFDSETGLYYYRARYYDPAIGRFIQPDPIGYSDGLNLYIYCSNNPLYFIDPWGMCAEGSIEWGEVARGTGQVLGGSLTVVGGFLIGDLGAAASLTGVGAFAGVPTMALGTSMMIGGGTTTILGISRIVAASQGQSMDGVPSTMTGVVLSPAGENAAKVGDIVETVGFGVVNPVGGPLGGVLTGVQVLDTIDPFTVSEDSGVSEDIGMN